MTTPQTPSTSAGSAPGAADVRAPERSVEAAAGARSIWTVLRTGLIASILCHAILILWGVGIWDSATPLAAMPPPSIAVDLVSSKDAPAEPEPPKTPEADTPLNIPPPEPPKQPAPIDQAPTAAAPSAASGPPVAPAPPSDGVDAKIALAERLADTLQLPVVLPGGEAGAEASESRAKLERNIVAEFKAHLGKCWTAAPGAAGSPRLRVVIRVAFRRDGQFLREPMLIQAVASPAGPGLVKNALKALHQCQPYAFMPADKYNEWKVLDLAFSPDGVL